MRAEVKSIIRYDGDVPSGAIDQFWYQLLVGVEGGEGEDSLQVGLCTVDWLERELREHRFVSGLHRQFVSSIDVEEGARYVTALVQAVEGATWDDIAYELRLIGLWDFEGYGVTWFDADDPRTIARADRTSEEDP